MMMKNPNLKKQSQNLRGEKIKNQAKNSRSGRNLPNSYYSNFQYLPHFFSISIPISISKFPKISISISKSKFWKCIFQYQYQNQYFETAVFNIKININMTKILTFQNFSKNFPMSVTYLFLIIGWEVRGSGMRPPRPPLVGGSDRVGSWKYRGMPAPSNFGL